MGGHWSSEKGYRIDCSYVEMFFLTCSYMYTVGGEVPIAMTAAIIELAE